MAVAASADQPRRSAPPFPLTASTTAPWREHALSRVGEYRFLLTWSKRQPPRPGGPVLDEEAEAHIGDHLEAAAAAAKGRTPRGRRDIVGSLTGTAVERALSNLDAAEIELLRYVPDDYLQGQLPSLLAHTREHLPDADPRRVEVELVAQRAAAGRFALRDRDLVVAGQRAANFEARREVSRLRSFRNVLLVAALFLTFGVLGLGAVGITTPSALPLCFNPTGFVVCPTSTTALPNGSSAPAGSQGQPDAINQQVSDRLMRRDASAWDVPLVMLVGVIAAAIAAAAALRGVSGTSTPHSLPVALALLKLPTGALTAVIGLLLIRGDFVPGLSALDSSAQIIAWAIVFGYAQQLLTHFIDRHAQENVLSAVSAGDAGTPSKVTAPVIGGPDQPQRPPAAAATS